MPNNYRTKAFGPPAWLTFHLFAMGYPTSNPSNTEKREYKKFFISFGHTLPCILCRQSYKKFIKEKPITNKVLSTRKNLVYWTFDIHNLVNKKLEVRIIPKKEYPKLFKFYDQFSATGCGQKKKGCITAKDNNYDPKKIIIKVKTDYEAISNYNEWSSESESSDSSSDSDN